MSKEPETLPPGRLVLQANTAADLMNPHLGSIRDTATLKEALVFFTDQGGTASPVINEAGQMVGVLSKVDILVHERERADVSTPDTAQVSDLMTPAVFSVKPDTPAARVVEEMLALKVHQLFVVNEEGSPQGVISAFDILKHLRP